MKVKVAQWCLTFCDPMDYTVHGILQARILEWVAYPFSSGSSRLRNRTRVSCIADKLFINWAIREALTNIDSTLKGRDITFPTKIHRVNAMVFPVVMYGCESCTIKKAEHWRIGTFELLCWMKLFRVPYTACRSNHSILKEINPENSLEGLMLKLQYLATWCEEPTH